MAVLAGPAEAGCLQEASSLATRAQGAPDWLRRETVLALVAEARRDARLGREAACVSALERARAQSRATPQ